ncbi:uncharacterized protein ALTATR162_LOCUS1254 [Alternaria atra]|uniref:Uncharacterized protein n=1 Tax=Alternaria atra TaxID=119953 RepID=A0A8J2N1L3_9PLEO|nr:uncharacterized protein ALTATR162_LOCUS1254 [Alternaria atra]CAG5142944.1 unnamed protein product [Alternaria atra]
MTYASQDVADHEYQILTAFRFPPTEDNWASKKVVPSSHLQEASEIASPTSDTTLFEDTPLCPINPLGSRKSVHSYAAYDDTLRKELPTTSATQVKEYKTTPMERRYDRNRRYVSSDPPFDVIDTPSTPFRSRAKTDDGLLLFRADPSKEPTIKARESRHRHKISLNLPVNAHERRRDGAGRPQQPDVESWPKPPPDIGVAHHAIRVDVMTAEERDLECKHRHTFIGTGSLDDFLEILKISTTHTATKSAIARAFVQLASAEQLYARQCSTGYLGWDLVSRTTLAVMDVTSVDCVVQLHVKLDSITLRQFLDLIPFNDVDEVTAMRIVEAFSVASHLDATAGIGTRSKARAFRSWFIQQMKAGADH